MKTREIRNLFLEYFKQHNHEILASSSLIPHNDPTLLFTNAGMVQFKQYFLGQAKSHFPRVATSQYCMRAGGKHNDLEQVGYTLRHHTFFEMLGNFSFGDYFKREAINFAWDFLTGQLKIPKDKLWVTVYYKDQESADIWINEKGVNPNKLSYCHEQDNFWAMGPQGPCGPCTEIYYDHGEHLTGDPPGRGDDTGLRYVEIWNLVFMQYERISSGELINLPMQSVDTGMGLERIAAVLQGVNDNYDIDIFRDLITSICSIFKININEKIALKVLSDHIRAASFLITEGIIPSNEGRGYVLRRIIRRALRYGYKLGIDIPFFYKLVSPLVDIMGEDYPALKNNRISIEKIIKTEEKNFSVTLKTGLKILESSLKQLDDSIIPGNLVFKLHDTYGFPIDLVQDIGKERNLEVDTEGYLDSMSIQKELGKKSGKFHHTIPKNILFDTQTSFFTGYEEVQSEVTVVGMIQEEQIIHSVQGNKDLSVILNCTPFYPEAGGQVGDTGIISNDKCQFLVKDTKKINDVIIHIGTLLKGLLSVGDQVLAQVNTEDRINIALNHTATHLLHACLRQVLGEHVVQKGSLVNKDKLRFDFFHYEALDNFSIRQIEQLVNEQIRNNFSVSIVLMDLEQAKKEGVTALFNEKYQDKVRVVSIGEISRELCGGIHSSTTGQIGMFKIISECSIASNIRRIEAVTGLQVLNWIYEQEGLLNELTSFLHSPVSDLKNRVEQILNENKSLVVQLKKAKIYCIDQLINEIEHQLVLKNGIYSLVTKIHDHNIDDLRYIVDCLRKKYTKIVITLVSVLNDKVITLVACSKGILKISAVDLIKEICGKGGGKEDLAQGGCVLPEDLDERLHRISLLIEQNT